MAMNKSLFIDVFPIDTSIYRGFPLAMFDYHRVFSVINALGLVTRAKAGPWTCPFFKLQSV